MSDRIRICLDAGHYGHKYNHSPVVAAYYESEMNWKLTMLQKEIFESKYGYEILLTRDDQNKDRNLFSRGYSSKGCFLFLSNHSNACAHESVDYPVAICLLNDDKIEIDDISREIGSALAQSVAETMGTTQPGRVSTRQSDFDCDKNGILDDEWYSVLNGSKQAGTPGIIMEHSFHTNTRSAQWLLDDDNLRKLAESDCRSIDASIKKILWRQNGQAAGDQEVESSGNVPTDNTTGQAAITAVKKYRVQIGAYKKAEAAESQKKKLADKNIKASVIEESGMYKIQAEPLQEVKANADAQLQRVTDAGFDAYIRVVYDAGAPDSSVEEEEIKAGSVVTVLKNVTYTGKPFRVYYDKYDVISISGDRVVIGIGNVVTCAIQKENVALA